MDGQFSDGLQQPGLQKTEEDKKVDSFEAAASVSGRDERSSRAATHSCKWIK